MPRLRQAGTLAPDTCLGSRIDQGRSRWKQLVARILLGQICFHFESVTEDFLVMLALRHGRGGPG